jgi:hypothetical protein
MQTLRLCRSAPKPLWQNGFRVAWSAYPQVVEERHDRVSGLTAAWDGGDRGSAGQSAFFEREVGVDVDLCGGNTFVAEPEGDNSDVDAGVQESAWRWSAAARTE